MNLEFAASSSQYVILASTSPRRRELLASLHIPFEVIPSKADETTPEQWEPEQIVMELALRKARAVQATLEPAAREAVIIGSDTIVVLDGQVLGKPKDEAEAASMLRSLQGRSHDVYTAVACIDVITGRTEVEYRRTSVTMRTVAEEEIAAYARTGEGLDKAGAYAIQGLGSIFVTGIEGCYFNVVGLPLSLLSEMLSRFGIHVLR
ncbi:Maf family protein [Paenibacillus woosongensis]|uniref:dTTP/UTP pyrophosphatase n=1 Tax=Paenibacillus woosongensis TaxID=307580 RepID=A0A7X2Z282_9BACL|nr:Maf family protein [Paenibacillus woosongensis]MUG46130.1 septum formation inhibitor Maf [Paenibacillus woosongensis]